MGIDLHKRHLMDFLKVGRSGKKYFVWGAPEGTQGPYDSHNDAQVAYDSILNDHRAYEIINRKIVKKDV